MSFIRLTRKGGTKQVDVNSTHVVSFEELNGTGNGTYVTLVDSTEMDVLESPRQIRSFIKKAQGSLPAPAES